MSRFPHLCVVAVSGADAQYGGGEATGALYGVAAFPSVVAFGGGGVVGRYGGERDGQSIVMWIARVANTWAENDVEVDGEGDVDWGNEGMNENAIDWVLAASGIVSLAAGLRVLAVWWVRLQPSP